jgi:hypothetical protein
MLISNYALAQKAKTVCTLVRLWFVEFALTVACAFSLHLARTLLALPHQESENQAKMSRQMPLKVLRQYSTSVTPVE